MFGEQFYPTPQSVIHQMVKGLDFFGKRVLDPSAGDGAILDYINSGTSNYDRPQTQLFAIEIDQDLQSILAGKGYKVIDSDFLQYNGMRYFDYIIMNPPFNDGVSHLLKAWDICNGAEIRCLLNSESLTNLCTLERQELNHIINQYGEVKDLGQCFKDSRRPTNVEVSLVILKDTRKKENFRIDFDLETSKDGLHLPNLEESELAPADIFNSYESRFNAVINSFKELLAARQKVYFYLDGLVDNKEKDLLEALDKPSPDLSYNDFVNSITESAWNSIFTKTKLANITTEGVRKEIDKYQTTKGVMSFTAKNMKDLFFNLNMNKKHIMVQCMLEVFDNLTKHYDENREYVEGWKTNSAYFVGKKFILPYVGSSWGDGIDYNKQRKIEDIEKALCFLTGKKFENINSIGQLYDSHKPNYGKKITSEFFETQLYKKKTMHFRWLDNDLRNEFNAVVAKERWGWLPEKIKTGVYK